MHADPAIAPNASGVESASEWKNRQALAAARMYYMQDLTMEAIASELSTSRSSVSRLLSYARASGLVEITVRSPREMPSELEHELRRRYGVVAHVVQVPELTPEVDRAEQVARYTARTLGDHFDSNTVLGIAWGSTMSAVSRHLVPKATHGSQIVQLNGAANPRTTGILYASEILERFGSAFGAYVQQFPVPAFFDDPATKRALWRERSIKRVLEVQRHMDVVLFGLGSPTAEVPSHVYTAGYLDQADLRALAEAGVVGDIATVFYRIDGSIDGIPLNERATGPDPRVLRRTPRRICVVSGASKVPALVGALAAGLVTDLYIDTLTARLLLERE